MYQKLRELRVKNKYTSQQMADKLGISKSFYSQIETGSRRLTYNMAVRISAILKRNPDFIFFEDETNKINNGSNKEEDE